MSVPLPDVPDDVPLGLSADLRLPVQVQAEVVWLPATALFQQGDKPAVWLLDAADKVQLQAVNVLRYERDGVLVQGLAEGSKVIAAGVHTLHEGQAVRPVAYDGAAARGGA